MSLYKRSLARAMAASHDGPSPPRRRLVAAHQNAPDDILSLFQRMNANIRRRTGVDYNIGMKMPVLMHQAGLQDVQVRISDAVRLAFPPLDTPQKEQVFKAICEDGLGGPTDEEGFRRELASMRENGVSE